MDSICISHYSIFVTGGTIHMVCRNKDKAEEARADIIKETGNKVQSDSPFKTLFFFKNNNSDTACYSEFVSCRKFMSTSWTCQRPRRCGSSPRASRESTRPSTCWWVIFYVADIYQNIVQILQLLRYCLNHILCVQINNAGSIMSQRDVNAEGLEKSFATNVLGESSESGEVRKGHWWG